MNKKCVIFDFDGTIADTSNLHAKAFLEVFEKLNIYDFEYDKYKGRKTVEVFTDFFSEKNINYSNEDIIEFTKLKQQIVRKMMANDLKAYEGAIDFINYLKYKDFILVLATSSSKGGITLALNKLGISDKFDYIITGDDVEKAKPDPEIYNKALKTVNVKPDEALVIEDSISGATAATRAEIEVVIVNNQMLKDKYTCTSFKDLLSDLKQLCS